MIDLWDISASRVRFLANPAAAINELRNDIFRVRCCTDYSYRVRLGFKLPDQT